MLLISNVLRRARKRDEKLVEKLGLWKKTVWGLIGFFYAYEEILLAIEVIPSIIHEDPDACLLLVGGGPQENEISDRILALGLGANVVLGCRVSHNNIQNYY